MFSVLVCSDRFESDDVGGEGAPPEVWGDEGTDDPSQVPPAALTMGVSGYPKLIL
jgi:hypothetical protein